MQDNQNTNPTPEKQPNNESRSNRKTYLGTRGIAGLVIITSLVGGGIGGGVVGAINGSKNNSSSLDTTTSGTKVTPTKVSNVVVNQSSSAEKAFSKVKDSVVSVINLQKQQSINSLFGGAFGGSTSNGKSSKSSSSSLQESSEGSGVIYQKKDGKAYVVTNNHVVSGSDKLEIILSDGTKIDGKLIGTDSVTDLAVVQIDASKVKAVATFGDSNAIKPGQQVLAIGSPMGSKFATSVTEGIISAKSRTIDVTDEDTGQTTGEATVIQTDAAINPGNSGGALINLGGQVIGINSMKLSGSSSSGGTSVEGMGFSIPSDEVVNIVNQLQANGKVARPALGISPIDLSDVSATQQSSVLKLSSDVKSGVVVVSLTNGSPAAAAGVKQYDVIYAINGKTVDSVVDLRSQLYKYKVGDTITLSLYRGSEKKDVKVKLTEEAKQSLNTSNSSENN